MEEIIKLLEEQIQNLDEGEMDDSSWGYEEGVLITGNQAKAIVSALKSDYCRCPSDHRSMITFTKSGDYCGDCGQLIKS